MAMYWSTRLSINLLIIILLSILLSIWLVNFEWKDCMKYCFIKVVLMLLQTVSEDNMFKVGGWGWQVSTHFTLSSDYAHIVMWRTLFTLAWLTSVARQAGPQFWLNKVSWVIISCDTENVKCPFHTIIIFHIMFCILCYYWNMHW